MHIQPCARKFATAQATSFPKPCTSAGLVCASAELVCRAQNSCARTQDSCAQTQDSEPNGRTRAHGASPAYRYTTSAFRYPTSAFGAHFCVRARGSPGWGRRAAPQPRRFGHPGPMALLHDRPGRHGGDACAWTALVLGAALLAGCSASTVGTGARRATRRAVRSPRRPASRPRRSRPCRSTTSATPEPTRGSRGSSADCPSAPIAAPPPCGPARRSDRHRAGPPQHLARRCPPRRLTGRRTRTASSPSTSMRCAAAERTGPDPRGPQLRLHGHRRVRRRTRCSCSSRGTGAGASGATVSTPPGRSRAPTRSGVRAGGHRRPRCGASLPPVRVSGEAAVFEATLLWEVRRGDAVVRSGFTSTAEGQRLAPYAFSARLAAGRLRDLCTEDDLPAARALGHDRLPPGHGDLPDLPRHPERVQPTGSRPATATLLRRRRRAAPGSGVTSSSRRVGRRVRPAGRASRDPRPGAAYADEAARTPAHPQWS